MHPGAGAPFSVGAEAPALPPGCTVNAQGHLCSAGCDLVELAACHGTPLYVFNEDVIRANCRAYRAALAGHPGGFAVAYAAKAALTLALAAIMGQEDLCLDVVSAGELHTALEAGFPAERVHFHGNNKAPQEIELAIGAGVGRFVVDNDRELDLLEQATVGGRRRQRVLLRVAPGIEAHTHDYIRTGSQDSKFGFALATGQALHAIRRIAAAPGLEYAGLHAHIGSQILDAAFVAPLIDTLLDLAVEVRNATGLGLAELNVGGGAGIRYGGTERTLPPAVLAERLIAAVVRGATARGLPCPLLAIEPGRSIVGEAGVALYTVGSSKRVPGLIPWVAVDGGMGDNIRPALYQAEYTVAVADRMHAPPEELVHVAGRYCESGDFLARSVPLPRLRPGDLLAMFSAGAYQYPMSSNYNRVPRPALLLVSEGRACVMVERETTADLLARDRLPRHLRRAEA